MNEETFNLSMRKFLKMLGVSSRCEIEQAVAGTITDGAITRTGTFPAKVALKIADLNLKVNFDGKCVSKPMRGNCYQ